MTDEEIRLAAVEFAKQNKIRIAKELTDPAKYAPDVISISAFMAGSPGAGKTEFSKSLIKILEGDNERRVVRIDNDEIRPLIPGFVGSNSYLFQGATSLIVEKMHDLVLHRRQNFILDNTFSQYEKAADNIKRSLAKSRLVFIFYIYQKPEVAWKLTLAREAEEGRTIPKEAFIEQFLGSRNTVIHILNEFKGRVTLFLVKKNFEDPSDESIYKISGGKEQLDRNIGEEYTREKLKKCL